MLQRCKYYHIYFLRGQAGQRNVENNCKSAACSTSARLCGFFTLATFVTVAATAAAAAQTFTLEQQAGCQSGKGEQEKAECSDKKFHRATFFTKS